MLALQYVFGGVEGAGRRRRQQTLSPLPKLPVCSWSDCLFLCFREWKVWAGLRVMLTVWAGWSTTHTDCILFVPFVSCTRGCVKSWVMMRGSEQSRASLVERMMKCLYMGDVWVQVCWSYLANFLLHHLLCFYWNHQSDTKDDICPTVTSVAFGSTLVTKQRGRHGA